MARFIYWDTALVVDDELSQNTLDAAKSLKPKNKDFKKGCIIGADEGDTNFMAKNKIDASDIYAAINQLNIIPYIESEEVEWWANFHSMSVGGKMAWHNDSNNSLAVSMYLGTCSGGQLQVLSPCGTQSVMISPRENRIVVLKAETKHRVLEVEDGSRDSLQFFIRYINR